MMVTAAKQIEQKSKLAAPFVEAKAAMDLQRSSARFATKAGQIVLRTIQDLARRQAEALGNMVADLTKTPGATGDGETIKTALDLQQHYLRVSVLGTLAQLQLGLEAAASTSAETLALVEDQLAEMTEVGSTLTNKVQNGAET